MTAQSVLIWAAFSLYTAATFAAFGYLFTKDPRASRAMLTMLGLGLVLHLAGFAAHVAAFWAYPENRFFLPLTSFFGALSYMALALASAFFVIEGRARLGILGAFVLPWAAGALGLAVIFASPETAPLSEPLRSYWLNFHPMLLMTAYAAFANAAGVAIAMLIQERQIKSRKPTELCYRLPSLDELDALNGRIIAWAYPLLLVGLAMGFVWSYDDWGRLWTNDTKIRLALVTAAVYGVFIWRRYVVGRRGRRNVYVSLLGFASVLLTFFGAELFGGRHSFMGGLR
ncbi:MAG TPA: cytochrome c biogenesis protein CcsA [Elusimicrobiota bacterium]|nr:cytochrome c biogenesis protein CcsA [Elusimicrobiota bacterium]